MRYPSSAVYTDQGLCWKPLDFEGSDIVTARIEKACRRWQHTRYMAGQQVPDMGVDCVRLVCGIMDELYGVKHEIPRGIQDQSLHDPEGAQTVTDLLCEYYPDHTSLDNGDRCVEPGDVIVTGHAQGGPGHAILVGAQKNTLWQAMRKQVRMGGFGLLEHYQRIFIIYRPDKTLWLPSTD